MQNIVRTNSDNTDYLSLVKQLDAYLAVMDGKDHSFYAQYNKSDTIKHVVLLYKNDKAVACGAIKQYDGDTMEVKRMFTLPEYRGKGYALILLRELEQWAAELGFKKCILETGKRQAEAVALYKKAGYVVIPNYGQYSGVENSLCFQKDI